METFENRYTAMERALYRLVFRTGASQVLAAEMEESMFSAELRDIENHRPVFVTALPRAGTTLLLEMIAEVPEFATHRYRDMPFVLCPMLGQMIAKVFRKSHVAMERAHGDGMEITPDSPEAFEEMVWKQFYPAQYRADRIRIWTSCDDEEFVRFFRNHMSKVIAIRRRDTGLRPRRYASKNNSNIARLSCLQQVASDAAVVVPFREPVQHASSLLRQHLRFSELHARDSFAKAYMQGIGHFDFGANLRAIDFGGWVDHAAANGLEPTGLSYWLTYWIAAYRYVLEARGGNVALVSYEGLCERHGDYLPRLAEHLAIAPESLERQAGRLGKVSSRPVDLEGVRRDVVDEAMSIYESLRVSSLS